MKLQKIVERLQKLHPKEIDLSLDRAKNLCQKLGNPQDQIDCISIVGTNGKYSTIQALHAILKEAKYQIDVYDNRKALEQQDKCTKLTTDFEQMFENIDSEELDF